jgi:hypothetical protein
MLVRKDARQRLGYALCNRQTGPQLKVGLILANEVTSFNSHHKLLNTIPVTIPIS